MPDFRYLDLINRSSRLSSTTFQPDTVVSAYTNDEAERALYVDGASYYAATEALKEIYKSTNSPIAKATLEHLDIQI